MPELSIEYWINVVSLYNATELVFPNLTQSSILTEAAEVKSKSYPFSLVPLPKSTLALPHAEVKSLFLSSLITVPLQL